MNFLVDVNLPPRLCRWLTDRKHQAAHLSELDSLRTPDRKVWSLAAQRSAIIITKDFDFYELSLVRGQPPQVVLIALGNCSNNRLLIQVGHAWGEIEAALATGARMVVLHPGRLDVFEK